MAVRRGPAAPGTFGSVLGIDQRAHAGAAATHQASQSGVLIGSAMIGWLIVVGHGWLWLLVGWLWLVGDLGMVGTGWTGSLLLVLILSVDCPNLGDENGTSPRPFDLRRKRFRVSQRKVYFACFTQCRGGAPNVADNHSWFGSE